MAADTLARLRTLRRQTGLASPPADGASPRQDGEGAELLACLHRLQARRSLAGDGRRDAVERAQTHGTRLSEAELAGRLGAEPLAPGLMRIRARHPLPPGWQATQLALPGHTVHPPQGLVFLDTETTGLAGGSGTLAFLVGLLRPSDDGLQLTQYLITRYAAEAGMLEALRDDLGVGARAWVTYNGKGYDLPLLETRSRLKGQGAWPVLDDHLDLLYAVRRGYADRWPDCRLATAEARLLGVQRQDDLPGAEAPEAWFRYLRGGDAGKLVRVVAHNRQDLLSLAGLLPAVCAMHRDPERHGANVLAIARHLHRALDDDRAALALLEASRPALGPEGLLELARHARRQGRRQVAVDIWERLARDGHQEAIESLAKHHEHVSRDYVRALALARHLQPSARHRQRIARLEAKMGQESEPC
ncbi:MAG TPA: hypothetical protein ENN19_03495 [Chloroflexi bacterium]|nr:hypothetical protein [Chloroflexota bacterium]